MKDSRIYFDVAYHENNYTLKGMINFFELPEELIRELQKHGLMIPEIVKFGSKEIEIYSGLDGHTGMCVMRASEKDKNISLAIAAAQAHVAEVYRAAHGPESSEIKGSPYVSRFAAGIQRKKLFILNELLEALSISNEDFQEICGYIQIEPMTLRIPYQEIQYYREEDYLKLQYILTLRRQGCSLEEAAKEAFEWGEREMGYVEYGSPRFAHSFLE
jgi:hypothetical protein